ncbi:MAG: hypothetical protein KAG61_03660, partial [Bacteriovoracaceae bacterium]|nr:hypothetical protein [Bacteriovoracaceae bacterium]
PPRIESFLRHLLGDERSYLYVLSWLRVAILYRNDTVLVMNGAKGTGKGVFSNLLQALVGIDHFAVAPKSLMSGQFNSVLEHKRAIYLDEFKITKENHANVKRITNALQSVEKKGVDAMDTVTYNSFLISNNDAQDMRIEHDDRRFSVIELSNLPLVLETATPDGLWTREEIAQFELDLAQPDCPEIVSFGHWLIDKDRNDLVDPNNPFRGETFHSLVFDHLTVWKQFIISAIYEGVDEGAFDSGERSDLVLLVDDIRKDFNTIYNKSKIHFPAKDGGLRGFLRSYVHKDIGKIGKLGRDVSGDEAILLDPIFIGDLIQLRDLKVDDLNNNTYSADDGGAEDL